MVGLTVDEMVAVLVRSNIPTIVVEGDDDIIIYRWLEKQIPPFQGDIFPCGGRTTLLSLYERRSEYAHLKTAFLADKDMWLFSTVPHCYSEIIWTTGYSIENDLYADSTLEDLLDAVEEHDFRTVLQIIVEWFAFEVEEYRRGNNPEVDTHPNEIVRLGTDRIADEFKLRRGFQSPTFTTIAEIQDNYKLNLRGKILFELLARYLSAPARTAKHSKKALLEIGLKTKKDNFYLHRIVKEINSALGNTTKP
jgi:hypothetical protein